MKKLIAVAIVLLVALSVSADPINLGTFPIGQWFDRNYDAVWDFASDNIRILDTEGAVLWNFAGKTINNFNFFLDGSTPGISFSCSEAGRSYRFLKPLNTTTVVMEITRPSLPLYTVDMPMRTSSSGQ